MDFDKDPRLVTVVGFFLRQNQPPTQIVNEQNEKNPN
jgi:hypothetical protein